MCDDGHQNNFGNDTRIILTHVEGDLDALVVPEHMAVNLDLESIRVHQMERTKTMLGELVDRWFAGLLALSS